ncbi:AAA family ATPase [Tenacibaculum maritimum]|uniref:AAA family ATPase n=1 Tax=Tenacibaculum maritimum TaxID=107401 RepID=UPI0038769117
MRIDKVYIEDFKNLKKFCIELDKNQMNTVLLGQNATGKSNFIEALVKIFKSLDLSNENSRKYPEFKYWIKYNCHENDIIIDYTSRTYKIEIEGRDKSPSFKEFFCSEGKKLYLPKYVFTYYSGISNRLDEVFWEHQNNFYTKIIKPDFDIKELDDLRRLFYVKPIHSFFVLLAFFSLSKIETKSKEFLLDVLGIEDLESVLFIIKKGFWAKKDNEKFWGADGLVKDFLNTLWEYSLAPIYEDKSVDIDFRRQETQKRLYLFIKDKNRLNEFAKKYFSINKEKPSNTFLFKALESTYISDMLEEVKVKVRKRKDGEITFKELSEGEQQLLTVIGLLIFTREDESLVLLDEPDTHLNPVWKYDYLHYLKTLVKSKNKLESGEEIDELEEDKTTQIIINTHDPLVIGSMVKSQVRLFGKEVETEHSNVGKPKDKYEKLKQQALNFAIEPDIDPQGLGVAGILTSELFGLPSILDKTTQIKLNRKRYLQGKLMRNELVGSEQNEYSELKSEMEKLGFYEESEDYWFKQYLKEMSKVESFQNIQFSKEEKNNLNRRSQEIAKKIAKQKKEERK